ncbi:hypothetical protein AX16_000715 [Volvariella volvacea WC 439]|nr:hypothetical protein AX16_000715 [Volvariella volvacea WC 439]
MAIASSLSRASSTSSIDSNHDRERFSRAQSVRLHDTPANPTPPPSRRTRKRFTNAQLTMLESLFHRNSHPSREEREAVAAAGGMYVFGHQFYCFSLNWTGRV